MVNPNRPTWPFFMRLRVPLPQDNPQSAAEIIPGGKLFFGRRFSTDGTVNCAACHDPAKALWRLDKNF